MAFPAVFELSSLNGTNGFAINGINAFDKSGFSVSNAGDVNGDGFDDLIIGASYADPNGTNSGQSYVVFGKSNDFNASLNLSTLDGTNGFALNGNKANDWLGISVSSAGDVNGDGFDDIIIGARLADPNGFESSGQSYVVFGKSGGFNASLNLSTLDGTNGFALNGINTDDSSGIFVSGAEDVNGDGFDDIIIGAPFADPKDTSSGQSYVVFGKSGGFNASLNLSSLDGSNGFALDGIKAFDYSGYSVSSAGDFNGDGFDDLLIGATESTSNGSGQSYVVFGKGVGFNASLNLSTLNGTNGFAIVGINAGDFSGYSVSSAGDFNGDGFDDLIIAAPFADDSFKRSYVVFGKSGSFSASLNLSTLDGTNGIAIVGFNNTGFIGSVFAISSVSGAGDFNGDGFDDLLIGSRRANSNGFESGQSYVVFGRSGGFSASLSISPLGGFNSFALNAINAGDYSGTSVSGAGDVNGDGFDDLIIGASGADPNGDGSGQSYVVFGGSASLITLAVSVSSVPEDGTANLIYTFTRTGNLTNPLTVNYRIGGTATNKIDYETLGTSVTFAANSATATVTVNPIADTEVEPNETVALTLVANPAYNIGTLSTVTGTIVDFANFDPAQYGASNPDLIRVLGNNLAALRQHYLDFGRFEARSTDNFDELRYLASNPDLLAFYGSNGAGATEHYLRFGFSEGRSSTSFDPAQYLASQGGDLINFYGYDLPGATLHYIQYGFIENRLTDIFSATRYIATYDDLTSYYGYNPTGGTEHYILFGFNEIQAGTRSGSNFDPAIYLATFPDLIQSVNQQFADPNTGAFIDNYASVLEFGNFHFITSGFTERRSRSGFDPNSYLNLNSDVQQAFGNDLSAATRHYIEYGLEEGRVYV